MALLLVVNDLSAAEPAENLVDANRLLREFSDLVTDGRLNGPKVLVTPSWFLGIQLCVGHPIGRLLAEFRRQDRDRALRVQTLVDKRSYYAECVPEDEREEDTEYLYSGRDAEGLFIAFSVKGLGVSFDVDEEWNVTSINLEKNWVEANDVQSRTFNVVHACRAAHLDTHAEWLHDHEAPPPATGLELWNTKGELFPSLDFCDSVEDQVKHLAGNDRRFKAILRGFQDLQSYCELWNTDYFDIHQLANASPESQSTLNMYADERTFRCPDGEDRLFNWHLKRGDTRIHFFDFPQAKRLLVGYAGPHLRISSQ